ncbi:hypothetical protein OS189_05120 [Sulfitobacter sp. F26169L]|uniref:hypothetical protein n=1 Tax=Sulfitobacter sp. F26169L TaxID=2996015 RepID=UPI002260E140|nr:hypothetical protein [Sulfitobacter sp. F26169L]MCX7565714.1 hypothetical protein [Sulfitobacter sp. F26169L]
MKKTDKNTPDHSGPKSPFVRQMIVSFIALSIMGVGIWSLMGQKAPYHPDGFDDEVSRGEVPALNTIRD